MGTFSMTFAKRAKKPTASCSAAYVMMGLAHTNENCRLTVEIKFRRNAIWACNMCGAEMISQFDEGKRLLIDILPLAPLFSALIWECSREHQHSVSLEYVQISIFCGEAECEIYRKSIYRMWPTLICISSK